VAALSAAFGEQVDVSGDYAFATACLHRLVGQARPGLQDQLSIEVRGSLEAAFAIALDEVLEQSLDSGNDVAWASD